MEAKLAFNYDREADILHIDKCSPYADQESEELRDDVVARLNPSTGEIENNEKAPFRGQFHASPHGLSTCGAPHCL
jgi:hypothetical protein